MQDLMSNITEEWPAIRDWLLSSGLRIAVTLLIAVAITWAAGFFIKRSVKKADKATGHEAVARAKRIKTVLSSIKIVIGIVVWILAGITVLGELGIKVGAILAGLGVAGVAVGFGAQNLVKDFLAGIFLLVENQIRVGDLVTIKEVTGTVESINLRITQIRGLDGHLYTFPNGDINKVENLTFKWSRVICKVGVAYRSQIEKVMEVLDLAGQDIKEDSHYGKLVLGKPEVKAIDEFAASSIIVALWIRTRPTPLQLDLGRTARRYIKKRFDQAGIEIPFTQVTLTLGPEEKRFAGTLSESGI